MLAARNRLRTSADFKQAVRSGARCGRRNLVLYTAIGDPADPTVLGFIVAKTVGNAVKRNLVKRRLRELGALSLRDHPLGMAIVVRALPPAANASWDALGQDYNGALTASMRRLGVKGLAGEKGQSE